MKKYDKSEWIVCFGYPWNSSSLYGIGNIVLKFHRDCKKILWINPIPRRNLSLKTTKGNKNLFIKRILRKLLLQIRIFRKFKKKFYILTPLYFPIVQNISFHLMNNFLFEFQVRLFFRILKVRKIIFISSGTNDVGRIINKEKKILWIHFAGDLFHELRNIDSFTQEILYNAEKNIFQSADIVYAASKVIFKKINNMVDFQGEIKYLPHGADFYHFSKKIEINSNIKKIQKPIIGYFGSLTEANDQNAIIEIAKKGYNVVLIGEVLGNYSECRKYKNIHFLGPIDYNNLPSFAQYFDVGIMNWKPATWINNCNPKKTFEYLSMGIPIVSVKIPQLEFELSEYIYFAESAEDFPNKVKIALNENSIQKSNARKNKAKLETWDKRFQTIIEDIN